LLTDQPLGVASVDDDGRWMVRFERHLRHDREKVWRAITESQHLAHWLPTDIVGERRAGAAIELPFWPDHVERYHLDPARLSGEIRVWEPPSVFEWTWQTDLLRWELISEGDGTRLTLTTWLGEMGPGAAKVAAGYHVCLANLEELLDTGTTATPLIDVDVAPWEQRYEEQVAAVEV
jgi:uncharacterized protein YndB with AHSA1/START domain